MPYIKSDDRAKFTLHADHGAEGIKLVVDTAGELQYCIALLAMNYLSRAAGRKGKFSYQELNDVMGALDGASKEFYRRVVAPYEDGKCVQNGDVYD